MGWVVDHRRLQNAINDNMPPWQFTLLHPHAKLRDAEKQTLVTGFQASLADNGSGGTPTPAPLSTSSGSDAVAIIIASCGSCHSADAARQFHVSNAADAQALVDAMIQQSATVTAAEEQTLIDCFTR